MAYQYSKFDYIKWFSGGEAVEIPDWEAGYFELHFGDIKTYTIEK